MNDESRCAVQGRHCGDPACTKFHGHVESRPKKPYSPPTLTRLGKVSDLTGAGLGSRADAVGGMMMAM